MIMVFIFWCFFAVIFTRLSVFAFKASWTILKVILGFVILPALLITVLFYGFIRFALPVLAIIGLITLLRGRKGISC